MYLKNKLIEICYTDSQQRKKQLINQLINIGIKHQINNLNVVCPSFENNIIVLSAHYDVIYKSYGYNDNGMALLIILNMLKKLPENVQIVFTDMQEYGGRGANNYIRNCKKNIIKCINLDCCGIGDYIYCDKNNFEFNDLNNCKLGKMPFCDSNIFVEYGIPTLTVSTSYKQLNFSEGLSEIYKTIHNNSNDNKIEIINFDLVDLVSNFVLKQLGI